MQRPLLFKLLLIGILTCLLLSPLEMIRETIMERSAQRDLAREDIARSWTGRQTFSGPVIAVPYTVKRTEQVFDRQAHTWTAEQSVTAKTAYILPEELAIDATITTEIRNRGIFGIPVYSSAIEVHGNFLIPEFFGIPDARETVTLGEPKVLVGVTDIRGFNADLTFKWQDQNVSFAPGTVDNVIRSGVHAPLPALTSQAGSYLFTLSLNLHGMDRLEFTPLGKETRVQMRSAWPHPMFVGEYLPEKRTINHDGFAASWQTTHFATNSPELLRVAGETSVELQHPVLGTEFIEPVDVYVQSGRSVKYGILFIVLTFAVFFMHETLHKRAIHPIQYGLVGCALAMFYLILLSLSEHIAFAAAYVVATGASTALLVSYLRAVLGSSKAASTFGATLVGLYGVLYLALQSEDYALLTGTTLLFGTLAVLMHLTRNIDWYSVAGGNSTSAVRT